MYDNESRDLEKFESDKCNQWNREKKDKNKLERQENI